MSVMTVPEIWSGQDRMFTVEDMEIDDGVLIVSPAPSPLHQLAPDRDRPELTVFSLRDGRYLKTAHVTGEEEYQTDLPFPVTISPSKLVALKSDRERPGGAHRPTPGPARVLPRRSFSPSCRRASGSSPVGVGRVLAWSHGS